VKITTNVAALTAQRNLAKNDSILDRSINKLSSGYRLNKAADDAAGMGIANKIRADIRSLMQASRNASQATALVQVAEGAVGTISNILDRMKELATQSASDSVTDNDRIKINAEFLALKGEITRITQNTKYQGQSLLEGTYGVSVTASSTLISASAGTGVTSASQIGLSNVEALRTYTITDLTTTAISMTATMASGAVVTQALTQTANSGAQTLNFDKLGITLTVDSGYLSGGLEGKTIITTSAAGGTFQVGTDALSNSQIALTLGDLTLASTGLNLSTITLTDLSKAQAALTAITTAIGSLNTVIGTIGAASNQFDYAMQNLQSIIENMGAAESVIRDADIGQEMTTFTKAQILSQAGTAMLAQANAAPQSVLSLLKG
jgi:flagellin